MSCMPSLSKMLQHHLPIYQALRSKYSTIWSSLRATVTSKGRGSSRKKNDSSFHKPSTGLYSDIEAYPGHCGLALVAPQYELGQLKSVNTYIESGNNETAEVIQSANDDRIHLIEEVRQSSYKG